MITARRVKGVLGVAVGLLLVLTLINRFTPHSSGPASSSYASAADGLAGYAALLARSGHPVARLRATPAHARLDPRQTLVLLDPEVLVPGDIAALKAFVAAGGRLIAGGREPGAWLSKLVPGAPEWSAAGQASVAPLVPVTETIGVGLVQSDADGAFTAPHRTLPVLGPADRALVTVANLGRGRIVLLADSSPLQNHLLAHADNAALGLALAGPPQRSVVFDEAVHGYGQQSGLAALPTRWKWTLVGLVLAALVMVAARFRRLGPVEPAPAPALPPRRAHVEALASALARTGDPAAATHNVRQHARALVQQRAGVAADADMDTTAQAAARLGLDRDEIVAVTSAPPCDDDVLAAGSALAKLTGTTR
ncbi:MAG TPA: DUF4350 domain-containing protein [Solirubrobacteraceae bacterium]|nr:DUF4350 domain-containing protein [Solirubrobacteraceae bacterium]